MGSRMPFITEEKLREYQTSFMLPLFQEFQCFPLTSKCQAQCEPLNSLKHTAAVHFQSNVSDIVCSCKDPQGLVKFNQ